MSAMQIEQVYLILADISGYTNFVTMHKMSLLHAEQIITELMEAVIDAAASPLTLNKLEGDAAFLYARDTDHSQAGENITRQVLRFFDAFKTRQQALIKAGEGGCFCDACCNIDQLKLKAILHYGQAVIKQIRQMEELAGGDVILAHRLLKNKVGAKEYLMMTENFYEISGGVQDQMPVPYTEAYDDIGQVKTMLYYPATPALEIPPTPRFSKAAGLLESPRLFWRLITRRLFGTKQVFHNLPA